MENGSSSSVSVISGHVRPHEVKPRNVRFIRLFQT